MIREGSEVGSTFDGCTTEADDVNEERLEVSCDDNVGGDCTSDKTKEGLGSSESEEVDVRGRRE